MDLLQEAACILQREIDALESVRDSLGSTFVQLAEAVDGCDGRIVVTGMGKSGHVARKIAATMASIGIPAFFMHPGEAVHGDLGIVGKGDIVIALSYSGETEEVLAIIPALRRISGVRIYSIVGRPNSSLERASESAIVLPQMQEVFLGDVPTSSTTAMMALGDALAVTVAKRRGFDKKDFALLHPHGTIGRKLTYTVEDVMVPIGNVPVMDKSKTVKEAIMEMCEKPIGIICLLDNQGRLEGIFTDGDLRRLFNKSSEESMTYQLSDVMNNSPVTIEAHTLAVDAANIMRTRERTYQLLPVVDKGILTGVLHLTGMIENGIIS